MRVKDVTALLLANGFRLVRQKGSHRRFEGTVGGERRRVTVPGKDNDEVAKGTLAAIRRQSGLNRKLFR